MWPYYGIDPFFNNSSIKAWDFSLGEVRGAPRGLHWRDGFFDLSQLVDPGI